MLKISLLVVLIVVWIIGIILIILQHFRQKKMHKLVEYRQQVNNAQTLTECLFIHIHMHRDGFSNNIYLNPSTDKKDIVFFQVDSLDNLSCKNVIINGKETLEAIETSSYDPVVYMEAVESYKIILLYGILAELHKI